METPDVIKIMLAMEVPFITLLVYFHKQAIARLDKNYHALTQSNRAIENLLTRHDERINNIHEKTEKAHERISDVKQDIYKHHGRT